MILVRVLGRSCSGSGQELQRIWAGAAELGLEGARSTGGSAVDCGPRARRRLQAGPGGHYHRLAGVLRRHGPTQARRLAALPPRSGRLSCVQYGHHTVAMWPPYVHHVVIIWSPYGHHTVIIWSPYGHHTVTWSSCVHHMVIIRSPCVHHMVTMRCLSAQSLLKDLLRESTSSVRSASEFEPGESFGWIL